LVAQLEYPAPKKLRSQGVRLRAKAQSRRLQRAALP
jgi:hypothetical protein